MSCAATDTHSDLSSVRTLSDLFARLPSPSLPASSEASTSANKLPDFATDLIEALYDTGTGAGEEGTSTADIIPSLSTSLHAYQRRAVAAILERENCRVDDCVEQFRADKDAHFKSKELELGRVRGGILCEEMGTGKTLECLAVILATKGTAPDAHQERILYEGIGQDSIPAATSRESLTALCVRALRSSSVPTGWLDQLDGLPEVVQRLLRTTIPFFEQRSIAISRAALQRSTSLPAVQPQRIYLSNATIVLVPLTLMTHWQDEIRKHVRSPESTLRTLSIQTLSRPIPSARELSNDWDLILLSYERFAHEASRLIPPQTTSVPLACRCPYIGSTRTVDCHCPAPASRDDASPLMCCRFKRIIIDEGNKMSGQSKMVELACKLDVENRWIVSGTPTEMLVATDTDAQDTSIERPLVSEEDRPCAWSVQERVDVEQRLGRLVCHFLRLPPFYDVKLQDWALRPTSNTQRLWLERVIKPLFPPDGVSPPPIHALKTLFSILQATMIRNRPADVRRDRPLPPLRRHFLGVTLSDLERKTFNFMQALISSNAILTKREGVDYFFHADNRKWLIEIIGNLWLACFHFAGPERAFQAKEAIKVIEEDLAKKKWAGNEGLEKALEKLKEAVNDRAWTSQGSEIDYTLEEMPKGISSAWRRAGGQTRLNAAELLDLQRGLHEILMRWHRTAKLFNDLDRDAEAALSGELETLGYERSKAASKAKVIKEASQSQHTSGSKVAVGSPKSFAIANSRKKEEKAALLAASKKSSQIFASAGNTGQKPPATGSVRRPRRLSNAEFPLSALTRRLPADWSLLKASISGTCSTKLNQALYILSLERKPTLVFSSQDNALHELSACLDILAHADAPPLIDGEGGTMSLPSRYSHRIFTSGVAQATLDTYVSQFKSGKFDILLIKTDRGGRGLDLHRATRVMFLEPETRPALERQAIKRAWRMGQTSQVDVVYLYARGTFEEEMIKAKRRVLEGIKTEGGGQPAASGPSLGSSEGNVASLLRDPVMRDYVATPRYIESTDPQTSAHEAGGSEVALHLGIFAPVTNQEPTLSPTMTQESTASSTDLTWPTTPRDGCEDEVIHGLSTPISMPWMKASVSVSHPPSPPPHLLGFAAHPDTQQSAATCPTPFPESTRGLTVKKEARDEASASAIKRRIKSEVEDGEEALADAQSESEDKPVKKRIRFEIGS